MTALNKQALREAAQEEIMLRSASDTSDAWQDEASPEAVLALLDELEAAEKRIAELEAVREVFLRAKALMYQSGGAPIENSLNPIDAWLYDAERAAAGIGVKGGGESVEKCNRCIVGLIGSQPVLSGDWDNAVANFEIVIADWNEKTKRFAVPHPGFACKFNYCPHCGNKVED